MPLNISTNFERSNRFPEREKLKAVVFQASPQKLGAARFIAHTIGFVALFFFMGFVGWPFIFNAIDVQEQRSIQDSQ